MLSIKISACLITKNEEKNIRTCLESVKSLSDEIIVVDTGSTDSTVEIAREMGARTYYFQWVNDFSKARNYAISKAKGDWIIFLDADEYLTKDSIENFPKIVFEAKQQKYDVIFGLLINYEKVTKTLVNTVPVIRFFRNNAGLEYVGAIHETVGRKNGDLKRLDATKYIKIMHTGYSLDNLAEKDKANRNLDLLLLELEKKPGDSNLCFYISEACFMKQDWKKAVEYANKVLKYNNGTLIGIYQKNYANLIPSMISAKYTKYEMLYTVKEAVNSYPDYPDFHFYLGDFFRQDGRVFDSINEYKIGLENIEKGVLYHSGAQFRIGNVLRIIGDLYYSTGQHQKCIENYIESLKTDIYDYLALKKLMRLLSKYEIPEDIYKFFSKMYDYRNLKDLLFLLKSGLEANNSVLAEMFFGVFDKSKRKELAKERAWIDYIKGLYSVAAAEFEELYKRNYDCEFVRKCIASAHLAGDELVLKSLSQLVKPSLKRIIDKLYDRDVRLLTSDKMDLLELIEEYVKCDRESSLSFYAGWLDDLHLHYEIAEILFHYEKFEMAAEFYNKYIENEDSITTNKMANILIKMGQCMHKLDQYELALRFFEDASGLNSYDYRAYETSIAIHKKLNNVSQARAIAERAIQYFPDSNYIKYILGSDSNE